MSRVQQQNRQAWDDRARRGAWYTETATERHFKNPLAVIDQCGWLGGDVTGQRVLCLAAGGGKQSALYAAAGAMVTVVDISPEMLRLDRQVAIERRLRIQTVEASMDDLSALEPASFEIVVQPVSTCYVPDVEAVYRQVARVTTPGGLYISQHKQPVSLQADVVPSSRGYGLNEPYHRSGPLPPVAAGTPHRESETLEFLHRWENLLGGLCRSGFVIEDVAEPRHANPKAEPGTFGHRSCFVPPYIKIKARRKHDTPTESLGRRIWTP
ncbi:MAG: class I SAM-dependent methyltransferase [Verrucomicrobia bacterium]|nr:class I SAM-dependent methyltransferase [Verrucomicrobiota bacterium]